MHGSRLAMLLAMLAAGCAGLAQPPGETVGQAEMKPILAQARPRYPKFFAAYDDLLAHEKLLRGVYWMRGVGPGEAGENGGVVLNPDLLVPGKPGFDDNRLVIVIYHEAGHLHYDARVPRGARTPEESEKAAFEYSLVQARVLADKGDCGPLAEGLFFMKRRGQSNNTADPHNRALKRILVEPLYTRLATYVASTPGCRAVQMGHNEVEADGPGA